MFKCRSPIPRDYFNHRDVCLVTQLFGENPNRLFYGPLGHNGWDMQTKGAIKFAYHNLLNYVQGTRGTDEQAGLIPIQAAHDGFVSSPFNEDRTNGIYVHVESEDGQHRTTYFHLNKVRVWKGDPRTTESEKIKGENFVKAGSIIGWAGNTGKYTTGAHLHFEVSKKLNGQWVDVDPLPYMLDETIYQRVSWISPRYFYKALEISRAKSDQLSETLNN